MSFSYVRTITPPGAFSDVINIGAVGGGNIALSYFDSGTLSYKVRIYNIVTGLPVYADTSLSGGLGDRLLADAFTGNVIAYRASNATFQAYNFATGLSASLLTSVGHYLLPGQDSKYISTFISANYRNSTVTLTANTPSTSLITSISNLDNDVTCLGDSTVSALGQSGRARWFLNSVPTDIYLDTKNLTPRSLLIPRPTSFVDYINYGFVICDEGVLLVINLYSGAIVQVLPCPSSGSFGDYTGGFYYIYAQNVSTFLDKNYPVVYSSSSASSGYSVINEIDPFLTPASQISQIKLNISPDQMLFGVSSVYGSSVSDDNHVYLWVADKSSNKIYIFLYTPTRRLNGTPFSFSGGSTPFELILIDDSVSPSQLMLKTDANSGFPNIYGQPTPVPTTYNKSIIAVAHYDDGVNEKFDAIRINT